MQVHTRLRASHMTFNKFQTLIAFQSTITAASINRDSFRSSTLCSMLSLRPKVYKYWMVFKLASYSRAAEYPSVPLKKGYNK